MKPSLYTNLMLGAVMALMLAVVVRPLFNPDTTAIAQGPNTQKGVSAPTRWEYKQIDLAREYQAFKLGDYGKPVEDGKALEIDWFTRVQQLGLQGWELVSVTPTSNLSGQNFAGSTSEVIIVLKRPKQ